MTTRPDEMAILLVDDVADNTLALKAYLERDGIRCVTAHSGETSIFIHPGFHFQRVDVLLTNFHLPRSTLFMLVCALGGTELLKHAYAEAVRERYRFYSYGDCMLIV